MKRTVLRVFVFAFVVLFVVVAIAAPGYIGAQKAFWGSIRQEPVPSLDGLKKPAHDASKPTVAVILGNETTEGMDFTIPYQLFSMTGAYNVYAVASDNGVRSLTGGVDVVPHYAFAELDAMLGRSPDIVAIPYMTMTDAEKLKPVQDWILKHKGTTLLSICAGADVLASTGLLNGKTGATHWQTMPVLTKKYPDVHWVQDRRYVTNDGGRMISSAGISSGIDASLYVISQQLGEPAAAAIAEQLHYPSYPFVANPEVEPYRIDMRYSTYVLNNAFRWNEKKLGVLLYEGVEEMAVASVLDIYSDSGTTRTLSIAKTDRPVASKHGLYLLARHTLDNPPKTDKRVVPGTRANELASEEAELWKSKGGGAEPWFVHSGAKDRFLFEVQLEDLAKQEDVLTAKHAAKRLEFRADSFELRGSPLPFETYGAMLLTIAAAVALAAWIDRKWLAGRRAEAK
ncbi:DJ-1/PfpI family protein [Paenibacillus flagellatus]|uniref:DJ-1/PfpI family protein n=1 Tax=Paenibacillus flagellatus TaxID=2211139 RepID=A0A2V5JWZ1_9BACL|nr:DJ-1/PfpI family protein [Paenibacillus flagellatus]PYI51345.1 DJ-1/PfpI family protein [Paenibacillus flagellatus]